MAVVQPLPANITLKRGESIPFSFEIQAITSKEDQLCSYTTEGLKPLHVIFEQPEIKVEAGRTARVFGLVEVPFYATAKEYNGWIIVTCRSSVKERGISMVSLSFKIPFSITVVGGGIDYKFLILISISLLFAVLILRKKSIFSIRKKLNKKFKVGKQIL